MKLRLLPVFLCLSCTMSLAENPPVTVYLNDRAMNVNVIETNGTYYLPVDAISKALGVHITVKTNEVRIVREPPPPQPSNPKSPPVPQPNPLGITTIRGTLLSSRGLLSSQPDGGAQVWLVTADEVPALIKAAGGTDSVPIPTTAAGWEVKLTSDYKFPRAVTDEMGRFSFDRIAPGSYLLIMRSNLAYGPCERDRKGKFRFERVRVGDGQVADFKYSFGVNWIGHN